MRKKPTLHQVLYSNNITSDVFDIFMSLVIMSSIVLPLLNKLYMHNLTDMYHIGRIIYLTIFATEMILNTISDTKEKNITIFPIFRRPVFWIDAISLIPYSIIPAPFSNIILIARFLKLKRFHRGLNEWFYILKDRFFELSIFFFTFVLFIIISSILILMAEHSINPQFRNIWDALWWSIVTITTVGYGDIYPITPAGKVIAAFIMITGISSIAILTSIVSTAFINRLIRIKMNTEEVIMNKVRKMNKHFIICGYGRMSEVVSKELSDNGKEFVIIEKNEKTYQNAISKGYLAILGDATEEETLKQANIEKAKAIVLLMDSDATNLYTLIIAREENRNLMAIVRADSKESAKKFSKLGAKVISPYQLSAYSISRMLISPAVAEFISVLKSGDEVIEIGEFLIKPGSKYSNRRIKDTDIRSKYNIIVIKIVLPNKTYIFNPKAEDIIPENSIIVCVGEKENMEKFERNI